MRSATQWRTIAITLLAVSGMIVGCANFPKFGQADGPRNAQKNSPDPSTLDEVDEPPVMAGTFFAAARLYESQRDDQNALIQFRKAIGADPNYAEAYERLGLLLSRVGRGKEAIGPLVRAVEIDPKNPVYRNNLGFEYALQKRWSDAEAELTNAVQLEPGFARAYINLGLVMCRQGKHEDGLDAFNVALPAPDAFYNLGLMFMADKRFQDAAQAFEHALALNGQFAAARNRLEEIQPRLALANKFEPVADVQSWNSVESVPNSRSDAMMPVQTTAHTDAPIDLQPESQEIIVAAESTVTPVRTAAWHAPGASKKAEPVELAPAEVMPAETGPVQTAETEPMPVQPVVESKPSKSGVFEFVTDEKEPSKEAPGDAATMRGAEANGDADDRHVGMSEEGVVETPDSAARFHLVHARPNADGSDCVQASEPDETVPADEPATIVFSPVQPTTEDAEAAADDADSTDHASDVSMWFDMSGMPAAGAAPGSATATEDAMRIDLVNPQESRGRFSSVGGKAMFFVPSDELFIMHSVDGVSGTAVESSSVASARN